MQSCILREIKTQQHTLKDLNLFHTINQDQVRRFSLVDSMEPLLPCDEGYVKPSQDEEGRKAAHVKWDGKTIALGTFCAAEAAEKCERAKALTKEWRATMVPKPDVKWVKEALERLNIRVVNDRPGRRKKEQVIKEREEKQKRKMMSSAGDQMYMPSSGRGYASGSSFDPASSSQMASGTGAYSSVASSSLMPGLPDPASNTSSLGFSNALPNSNFPGMSNATTHQMQRRLSNDIASFSRRFSNERSAMGYDDLSRSNFQGLPSQGQGMTGMKNPMGNLAHELGHVPSPSRRHYQVLKEHHDNLLKELQQTTYMMEMYQNCSFEDEQDNANLMGMNPMLSSPLHDMNMDQRRPSLPRRLSVSMNNSVLGSTLPYDFATSQRRDSLGISDFQSRRGSLAEALSGMNQMNHAMTRPSFHQNAQFHLSNQGRMNQGNTGGQGQKPDSARRQSISSDAPPNSKRTKLEHSSGNNP